MSYTVLPWMPYADALPVEFMPHKKINVILGVPGDYPEDVIDGEIYIYISSDISETSERHICSDPHMIFKLKSGEPVHPICCALWDHRGEITYIYIDKQEGPEKQVNTIYDLMILVKSYNRLSKYGIWRPAESPTGRPAEQTTSWVVTPYRPHLPFHGRRLPGCGRPIDEKHLDVLYLELSYYAENSIDNIVYDCGYHLYSTATEITVVAICFCDLYINYVGTAQCHVAVIADFRKRLNQIFYLTKEMLAEETQK
jgi:hypothetical protein